MHNWQINPRMSLESTLIIAIVFFGGVQLIVVYRIARLEHKLAGYCNQTLLGSLVLRVVRQSEFEVVAGVVVRRCDQVAGFQAQLAFIGQGFRHPGERWQ